MRSIKILLNGQLDDYTVRSLHKRCQSDSAHSREPAARVCEITNITLCGALVLVPENITIPETKLKITIPSTAINLTRDTVIESEIRWSDVPPSSEHTRLGLMFTGMNRSDRRELKKLLLTLESPRETRLPCLLAAA